MQKTSTSLLSDQRMIQAITGGNQESLCTLNQRYSRAIRAVADRILKHRLDAEEIVTDVLWQVWRQARDFNPRRGSVRAWVKMLARSRAIDHLRARNTHLRLIENVSAGLVNIVEVPDASHVLHSAEIRSFVAAALQGLQEKERVMLQLAYYSDLPQSVIAKNTNLPLGTIKSRVRIALAILKKDVKGLEQWTKPLNLYS